MNKMYRADPDLSFYDNWSKANSENGYCPATNNYGKILTYEELEKEIDVFCRSYNRLTGGDATQSMAQSLLADPSNLIGQLGASKMGINLSQLKPSSMKKHPRETLDQTNVKTLFISDSLYLAVKDGIAKSGVKNIIITPLVAEDIVDEAEMVADIKAYAERKHNHAIKYLPSSLILRSSKKGYKGFKKDDLIDGVNYMNFADFMNASRGDDTPVDNNPRPNDITLVRQTSGSTTGRPSPIGKSDADIARAINAYRSIEGLDLGVGDKNGNYMPVYIDTLNVSQIVISTWGVEQVYRALAGLNGRLDQALFYDKLNTLTTNNMAYKPLLYTSLPEGSLWFFRHGFGGGEFTPRQLQVRLDEACDRLGAGRLKLGFGTTYFAPAISVRSGNHRFSEHAENNIGVPLDGTEFRIVDRNNGRKMKPGEIGLIYVKSDSAASGGYLDDREVTEDKHTLEGFHNIEDVGYETPDGSYYALGREQDYFIGNDGKEHHANQINDAIFCDAGIYTVSTKVFEVDGKKKIQAFIQLMPGAEKRVEEILHAIIENVKDVLGKGAWPEAYHFVEDIPFNDAGKTDFKLLDKLKDYYYTIEYGQLKRISYDKDNRIVKRIVDKDIRIERVA